MKNTVQHNPGFFVITGGPGAGKTSLLNELERIGYRYEREVARDIIREQLQNEGEALPWQNRVLYLQLMLQRSVESYGQLSGRFAGPLFFDRSIIDTIAYAKLIGVPVDGQMTYYANQYRYNRLVFVLPPWREIYTTDTERKQTWQEAVDTYDVLAATYLEYGYEITHLPKTSIQERAEFLVNHLKTSAATYRL